VSGLNQLSFYESANPDIINSFTENSNSKLNVHVDIYRSEANVQEWIDMLLFSIPYVMKALEKPNKQIITEEEVVKVELIKKVSMETIKHLSKNTNLISDIDEETGDVQPEKLLNAFKEENFLTYENKFIYSLVRLMQDFLGYKKKRGLEDPPNKNLRQVNFVGKTKIDKERVKVETEISIDRGENTNKKELIEQRLQQVKMIEEKLAELRNMEMYKMIDARKITLTKSPLKMTNVLLKNVNFQYAVKLWNFLNDNFEAKSNEFKEKKDYEDKGLLLTLYEETFLLNYLNFDLIKTKDQRNLATTINEKEMSQRVTEMMVMRILELNPNMTESELKQMLAENFIKIKSKYSSSTKQIEEIFTRNIHEFVQKLRAKRGTNEKVRKKV